MANFWAPPDRAAGAQLVADHGPQRREPPPANSAAACAPDARNERNAIRNEAGCRLGHLAQLGNRPQPPRRRKLAEARGFGAAIVDLGPAARDWSDPGPSAELARPPRELPKTAPKTPAKALPFTLNLQGDFYFVRSC